MIIDCFSFCNELEILECRLDYLNSYVDHFVIVESDNTYSGNKKELNFELNKSRFEKFLNKITYLPYVNINRSMNDFWTFEAKQRDYISIGLEKFSPDDIVIVSDVDEIPNPKVFKHVIEFLNEEKGNLARLVQSMFLYNLRTKQISSWERSYMAKVATVLEQTPNWLRSRDDKNIYHNFTIRPDKIYDKVCAQRFENGGWHLSYFMNIDEIVKKIESFSHTELNNDYMKDKNRIQKCIDEGTDLFDRPIPFMKIDINEEFDLEFLSIFERWRV